MMNPWRVAHTIWTWMPYLVVVAIFVMFAYFVPQARLVVGFIGGVIVAIAIFVIVQEWLDDQAWRWQRRKR